MSAPDAPANASENISLRLTRLFDAPPQRVFDAWLDPEQMAKWMGPRTIVASMAPVELDARVGGRYLIEVHTRDDAPRPACSLHVGGVYREITRYTRLVFTWGWADENVETLITLTFRPVGDKTELTLVHERFDSAERRDGHHEGWTASFDQLAALLARA